MGKSMWVRSHRSCWGYGAGIVGSLAIAAVPTLSRPAFAAATNWQFDPSTQALEVSLPEGVTPRYFLLAEPARIVVDLPVDIGTTETANTYSGSVRQVRVAQFQPGLTRIVLELAPGTTLAPGQVELRQVEGGGSGNRWIVRPLVINSLVSEVATAPDLPITPAAPTAPLPPSVAVPPAPSAASVSDLPSVTPTAPVPPVAAVPAPMPSTPPEADLTTEVNGIDIPVSPPPASTAEATPIAPEADGLPETFLQPGGVQPEVQVPALPSGRVSRDLPRAEPSDAAIAPAPDPEPITNRGNAQDLTLPPATRLPPTGRIADTAPAAVPDLPATPLSSTVSSEVVRVPDPPAIPRRTAAATPPPAVPEPEVTAPPVPVTVVPPTPATAAEPEATPPLETVAVTPQPPSVPLRSITFGQPLEDEPTRSNSTVAVAPTRSEVLLPANTVLKLRYPRDTALLLDNNIAWQEVLVLDEDLREAQTGRVLVPAGTQVIGRFETGRRGSRFIAQAISLQGRNLKFSAESEPIDGDRQVSHNQLLRNSGIGAAAATVIGGFSGVGLLAGLAAGAATTYVTAPQAAVIQPQQIIEIRVIEDLPRSLLE